MDRSPAPFRALILEDHEFQREVAAQLLYSCGAEGIFLASDGASALDIAHREQFDIVLCDLSMPGNMDGLQFLRHLAQLGNASSVILVSALDASILRAAEIMAKSYGIRLAGIVEKPLTSDKLIPLILRHFAQTISTPRSAPDLMALSEIMEGIERRQFLPYFQPKVDIRTCAIVGVEALMRWDHPERGLIPPAAFIPVMEVNGLITPVTDTLVDASLTHCKRWHDEGRDVPIAINVSVESLTDVHLPDRLEAMMLAVGLAPSFLMLEVTETVAMTDLGASLETLARCRMKGFSLSIDDYGTGFSSMQQLTRLPLSELKIDQTFVTGAATSAILRALVETSVLMAQRLHLKTTAEGVETSDDWDVVANLGCDVAQGYFIAKPMPGEALLHWRSAWLGGRDSLRDD